MGVVNLILIVVGIVIAYYAYKVIKHVQRNREVRTAIENLPHFNCTYSHVGNGGYDGVAIDETNGMIYFLSRTLGRLASYRFSASDVVSVEVFEDAMTHTVQSGGGIIVMLGRIGVPIGGPRLTTRYRVARLELKTVVNDPAMPVHRVTFIGSPCKREGIAHRFFGELAQQWQARIHVLSSRARRAVRTKQQLTSVADELRKLVTLKADGLVSDSEFDAQRTKLLA